MEYQLICFLATVQFKILRELHLVTQFIQGGILTAFNSNDHPRACLGCLAWYVPGCVLGR